MAQHGYLGDNDERFDRSDDRERWRDEDRERNWRGGRDRDPNFMFERGSDRDDQERGFFERMGDEARSWFRDDDREARGGQRSSSSYGREQSGLGGRSERERSRRNFSSHQDDHYRSWRDRQMEELDRDYAEYCREREQRFHSDFDAWRSQRRSNEQPLRTGMTQTSEEVMELTDTAAQGAPGEATTPMGAATLGTTSSDEGTPGRGRR